MLPEGAITGIGVSAAAVPLAVVGLDAAAGADAPPSGVAAGDVPVAGVVEELDCDPPEATVPPSLPPPPSHAVSTKATASAGNIGGHREERKRRASEERVEMNSTMALSEYSIRHQARDSLLKEKRRLEQ
ncbi:hypothetical protein [Burkholderia sp. THE68]|uniref:hypothetical protein n=1 Tax=Burkholderia sp. THE68 TaxID=758782 RepID=UPI001389BC37|nr:hypothetical protein [Burkholderia sp. THE68]